MLSTSTMVPTMLQSIKVGAVVGASNELGCAIHSLDWSNCENLVVGCSDSQNKNSGVYIWSVNSKSMELLRFCNHHEGGICSAKFMIPPVAVLSSHLGSIDPTSLTAMWSRRLIASVGADDKNIKIFDAETGISLSVMEERHGIVDFQPVAPSRYQGNLNSEENATKYVEREYGKLIYASDDMKLKLCSIELCQTRKGTSALSNKNTNGNLELYYYRITTVMNMQFQHHIVSIGKDICHSLQLLPESVFDFIISFATNGGLKMITVKVLASYIHAYIPTYIHMYFYFEIF
jgi:WD40 repeat protein